MRTILRHRQTQKIIVSNWTCVYVIKDIASGLLSYNTHIYWLVVILSKKMILCMLSNISHFRNVFEMEPVKRAIRNGDIEQFKTNYRYSNHNDIERISFEILKLPHDKQVEFVNVIVFQIRIERVDIYEYVLKLAESFALNDGVRYLTDNIAPRLCVAEAIKFADGVWK